MKICSPPGTEAEWTCGHIGGAMCKECHRLLIAQANRLAEENLALRVKLGEVAMAANKLIIEAVKRDARIAELEKALDLPDTFQ